MTKDEESSQIKGKQQAVASPIEPVVSSELTETLREIKTIIKSNTRRNRYMKTRNMTLCNDELFRLKELIDKLG